MVADAAAARGKPGIHARGVSTAWALCAAAFFVASLVVGLGIGPVAIGPGAIVESALSHVPFLHVHSPLDSVQEAILWQLRAPRVVAAALVGGMLAISGSAYQGVFRNPLADPYLLGVAAGAGLGATIAIAYGPGSHQLVPVAAFVGGTFAVVLTYALGRSAGRARATGALVLAGVTVAAFLTAIQTFVQGKLRGPVQYAARSFRVEILAANFIARLILDVWLQVRIHFAQNQIHQLKYADLGFIGKVEGLST